jgi:hypothetical protein
VFTREDKVTIYGSKGKIEFSILTNIITLSNEDGKSELFIEHPENVQFNHVQAIKEQLLGNTPHPSNGKTASRLGGSNYS